MSDELAWDPKSRALVHPRRGSPVILPKSSADKSWTKVTNAFDAKLKAAVSKGRKEATPEDRALIDAAVAGFAKKKSPPEEPDAAVEGVRAQLLGMEAHFNNMDKALLVAHDALVHLWCVAYGVPFAVAAMIETFKTARVDIGSIYVSRDPKVFGTFGNINHYMSWGDPIDVTPWHVLRAHVAACDDDTYAKAREVAEPFHDKGNDLMFRCALSFVFPDEEAWARETLEKCSYLTGEAPTIYHCGHALVSSFRDKPTIARFFDTGSYHPELAYDILDVLGAGAFPMLRKYYESCRTTSSKKQAFMPLVLVQTPLAIEWLRRQVHDPVVGKFVP